MLPAGVRLDTALSDPSTQVLGKPQLQQELMNLYTSAWLAMLGGERVETQPRAVR